MSPARVLFDSTLARWASRDPGSWRREQEARGFADGERGHAPRRRNRYYLAGHARGLGVHRRGMARAGR